MMPAHRAVLGINHVNAGRLMAENIDSVRQRFEEDAVGPAVNVNALDLLERHRVEHAERFGLAQLHQLRGRVGRGAAKSYCILMTGQRISPLGEERLNAMVRTQDGFELAELDLSQRGPGEFFGTRQAGLPDFRVANLVRDRQLLELAKLEAARFANPSALEKTESSGVTELERTRVWARLKDAWQRRYGLVEAG